MTLLTTPTTPTGTLATRSTETVHIVTWRLFDYEGVALTYGGLQRWLLALIDLLTAAGHSVVVHQRATAPFQRALREGVIVRGHRSKPRAYATALFNRRVHRVIPTAAPVIYMAEDVAFPTCRSRSAVIQHGIWWDGEFGVLALRAAEFMARRAVRRSAGTICVDTNFINWFRARWPQSGVDHKLHFVPNFIRGEEWGPQPDQPAATQTPGGRITVCFPRRSEPRRGILLMAEVAPRLMRRHPEVDFRFVVGSGHYTELLRERLAQSGVAADRWGIEVLPFDRMRAAYEQSAIVTIPTICGEGTSLSAIEAMYFGCAVVSTWVGGLPNLIQDGHNGLLIAPDAAALEAALTRLILDAPLRERLGRRAMENLLPHHGPERWKERVQTVLASALELELEGTPVTAPGREAQP